MTGDAQALLDRGHELREAGRPREALEAYREVVRRFGDDRERLANVISALRWEAWVHMEEERPHDALPLYDEVVRRVGDEEDLLWDVTGALIDRARALADLERSEDAIAAYREAAARSAPEPERLAAALKGLAFQLWIAERYGEAADAYEAVLAVAPDEKLEGYLRHALSRRAHAALQDEDFDTTNAVAERLLARVDDDLSPAGLHWQAGALELIAVAHARAERFDDGLAAFRRVIDRFAHVEEPQILDRVAIGAMSVVNLMAAVHRDEDSDAALRLVVARYGDAALRAFRRLAKEGRADPTPARRRNAVGAMLNIAAILRERNRVTDAVNTLDDLIASFDEDDDEQIHAAVLAAHDLRDELIDPDVG